MTKSRENMVNVDLFMIILIIGLTNVHCMSIIKRSEERTDNNLEKVDESIYKVDYDVYPVSCLSGDLCECALKKHT